MKLHYLDNGDGMSLSNTVYLQIKDEIISGRLHPGDRIMEMHLADMLGVSRTPVREAIHRLAEESLVTLKPGCGARVASISKKDMADALDARIAIETLAARIAANNATEEHIEKLKAVNLDIKRAYSLGNYNDVIDLDSNFHRVICEIGGNKILLNLFDYLEGRVLRYRVQYIKTTENPDDIVHVHQGIIQAFEAHDEKTAEDLMERHIRAQKKYFE